ncbi:MAG: maleylpyruvate isomerase family mycothiol-dependent enzyme [Chloroflexota bacterium]
MTFDTIRHCERREIDRLRTHLAQLDADGWLEQSYCTDWRVYQAVSHIASGARIFLGSLSHWFDGAPPLSQEQMRMIWATFDALEPARMFGEFQTAAKDYFARLDALPAEAGLQEVDGFLGKVPARDMLALRLHEIVLHTWDVLVARDRMARIPDDAVEILLPTQLWIRALRTATELAGKTVRLRTPDGTWRRWIDFRGEKPVVTADATGDADIDVQGPPEELCRLLGGRHFLPGSLPRLTWQGGSYQEIRALNIFGS